MNSYSLEETKKSSRKYPDRNFYNTKSLSYLTRKFLPKRFIEMKSMYDVELDNIDEEVEDATLLYINKKYRESQKLYLKCAKKGHVIAQHNVAHMYLEGIGIRRSLKSAIKWYTASAEQGNSQAYKDLSCLYETDAFGCKDHEMWFKCLYEACRLGDSIALNKLGLYFQESRMYSEAFSFYKRAADLSDPLGYYNLGNMYLMGLGRMRDDVRALELFEIAGDMHYPEALFYAGMMYYHDKGVTKTATSFEELSEIDGDSALDNYVIAINYLSKAYDLGYDYAIYMMQTIKNELFTDGILRKIEQNQYRFLCKPSGIQEPEEPTLDNNYTVLYAN